MPYAKSSKPPLTNTQIIDQLMEGCSPDHPDVVLTDRGQVFDAALRAPKTHAAIVKPTPDASRILQETLVDIWERSVEPDPFYLKFHFGPNGVEMQNPARRPLAETEAKALAGYAHLLCMHFDQAAVFLEISPQPAIDFSRLGGVPVIAASFFQSAFAWHDKAGQPHLVVPGSVIGSRQGAVRAAQIDLQRPVLSLMARPAL